MSKIIFLDIDGVLNNVKSLTGCDAPGTFHGFDSVCITRLKKILSVTRADIVVSSSWRHNWDHCVDNLLKVGLSRPIDFTPDRFYLEDQNRSRGSEIAEWLRNNPSISRFVIIDDDSDMLPEQIPFFVQTKFDKGLTDDDVEKVIRILNNEIHT